MTAAESWDSRLASELELFRAYAHERRSMQALDIASGAADVQLFRDSLLSALAHVTLREPPRDAQGEPLALVAGYLDTMTPNAVADRLGERHYIGMNTALFVAVHEFAMFCFTQRDFFPDVGDPTLETSPKPLGDRVPGLWLLDFTSHGGSVGEQHGQHVTPRGTSRYNASIYLGMLMARFAWLHEFQHCFNGHVRYVQDTGRALYLTEIEEPASLVGLKRKATHATAERDQVQRSLELDADRSAFWTCCRIQLDQRENMEGLAALDLGLRLRLTLFGAYAMTWLFEEFQNYLDAKEGVTHPDPYLRLQNLVATAAQRIEPLHGEFALLNQDACRQFDAVQKAIPSLYRSDDLYRGAGDPHVRRQLDEYDRAFAAIAHELARCRYSAA